MNRLTKRYANGDAGIGALSDGIMATAYTGLSFDEIDAITAVIDKLADFEDAEEQGRLVRLPCKVGDTVYAIVSFAGKRLDECEACVIEDITIFKNNIVISFASDDCCIRHIYSHQIGETVFLTREEAERALKGATKCIKS